jgi:signal transduction histidine kinase/CheY-like chemotaxis protein
LQHTRVLGQTASAFQHYGRRHFALLPDPGTYMTKVLQRDYNVHVIPYSGEGEHAELLQRLRDLRTSVMKHRGQLGPTSHKEPEQRRFPYKFLDFYDVDDRDLFFGREDEVQHLAARVAAHRFLVLFGQSGAGKTSLIKAGLLPDLSSRHFRTAYCRLTNRDARETLVELTGKLSAVHPPSPSDLCSKLVDSATGSNGLVVLLDQFEHAFHQPRDVFQYIGEFLRVLTQASEIRATVLICLREDYFVRLDEFTPWLPEVFHNRYRLGGMSEEQAAAAIREPAKKVDLPCEEEFVRQVVEDLAVRGTIEGPQLQIICTAMFEALKSGTAGLNADLYRSLGGARLLIKNHIRLVLEDFTEGDREIARAILKGFISSANTRTQLSFHHILAQTGLGHPDRVHKVLENLISRRLVRAVRAHDEQAYELPHDYMIPHIDEWISQAERTQRRVLEMVRYESEIARRDGNLIPAERARELERRSTGLELAEDDRELIQRSVLAADRADDEHRRLEEQFRQSQKMEAVGRLAGGVAHDFNNLLTIVSGYGQMLWDDLPPDDPKRDDLQQIIRAAERASQLTRQLLSFSRRSVTQLELLDANAVLTSMNRMVARLVGEDIRAELQLSDDTLIVKGDTGQLEQALLNLIVNARDAMPSGGRLTMRTSPALPDQLPSHADLNARQEYVRITISDTGTGMSGEVKAHLFEPFFTTKGARGSGLGLSTAYGIAKQHNGTILVESEIGCGSTFSLLLPRVGPEGSETPEPLITSEAKRPGTVLLVEDEPGVLELGRSWLLRAGYQVLTAENGNSAIAQVERAAGIIDTVVTDLIMPGMSGVELASRLNAAWPTISICFISGYPEAIAEARKLYPHCRMLQKPFTAEQMIALLASTDR